MPFAPTLPVPIEFAPSRNVTVPVIVPAVVEVAVAVSVTVAPLAAGLGDALSAVEVGAWDAAGLMTSDTAVEVDMAKFASPPYFAVIECVATLSVDVCSVATPPAPTLPVPIEVEPSRKVTVPVIEPAVLDVTVALRVTVCPAVAGFGSAVRAVVVGAGVGGTEPALFSSTTLPTTRPIFPLFVRSAAAAGPHTFSRKACGASTIPFVCGKVSKVPLPTPGKIPAIEPGPETKRSSFPSPSKSARTGELMGPKPGN